MTYEPNEAEIKAFQVIISRELYEEPSQYMAQVILRHYEPRTREQRCNRSGYLYGRVLMGDPGPVEQRCPGCVNCAVEPAKDGGRARGMRESVTTSGTGVAQLTTPPVAPINPYTTVKLSTEPRDFKTVGEKFAGAIAGAKATPITIALDDRTLRAIYSITEALLELQYEPVPRSCRPSTLADFPGIAEIDKAKEASK